MAQGMAGKGFKQVLEHLLLWPVQMEVLTPLHQDRLFISMYL